MCEKKLTVLYLNKIKLEIKTSYKNLILFLKEHHIGLKRFIFASITLILLISVFGIYGYLTRPNYNLTKQAQKLIGSADISLAKDNLKYSKKDNSYILNSSYIGQRNTINQYNSSIRGGTGNYSFVAPTNLGKKQISFYDNVHGISFSLSPVFKTARAKYAEGRLIYPINSSSSAVYSVMSNGLKEDIIINKNEGDKLTYKYNLNLPSGLEARVMSNGSIGVYSADPILFGNINYSGNGGQDLVDKAKSKGVKNYLVFVLMSPTIASSGSSSSAKVKFSLSGNNLAINAYGLSKLNYPISIDPSVVVMSANNPFGIGNNEYNVSTQSNQISTTSLTGGALGNWTSDSANPYSANYVGMASTVYNGYIYLIGGCTTTTCTSTTPIVTNLEYASLTSLASGGTWNSVTISGNQLVGYASAAAYNGYLYLIGGYSGTTAVNTVSYIPICTSQNVGIDGCTSSSTSGSLGSSWCDSTAVCNSTGLVKPASLTVNLFDSAAVTNDGYVYVINGANSGSTTNSNVIYEAKFLANGSIASWSISANDISSLTNNPQANGLRGLSAQVYNGYLYILGGISTSSTPITNVYYAPISNGLLGSFSSTTNLTLGVNNFGSAVYGGYIYVWGGDTSDSSSPFASTGATNNAYYAQINASGTIGSWYTLSNANNGQYSTSEYGLSGAAYNGVLYSFGGNNSPNATYNTVASAGSFANSFGTSSTGLNNLFMPAVTVFNGYIYVAGGCNNDTSTTRPCNTITHISSSIYYAQIGSSGVGPFSTASNTLSNAVYGATAIVAQGYLFIIGGCIGPNQASSCASSQSQTQYSLINENTGAPGSFSINYGVLNSFGGGAVYFDNIIYSFGGCMANSNAANYFCGSSGGSNATTSAYYATVPQNPTSGISNVSWTATTSLPYAFFGGGYAEYDGYLYIAGGCPGSGSTVSSNECGSNWTSANQNWDYVWHAQLSPSGIGTFTKDSQAILPNQLFGLQMTIYNGALFIFGGCSAFNNSNTNIGCASGSYNSNIYKSIIDPSTNVAGSFSTIQSSTGSYASGFVAEWGAGIAISNDQVFVVGGCSAASSALLCSSISNSAQYQTINLGGNGSIGNWNTGVSEIETRYNFSMTEYNGYLYLSGGFQSSGTNDVCNQNAVTPLCNDVEVYQIGNNGILTWKSRNYFSAPRAYLASAAYNGYFYISGGDNLGSISDIQIAPINSDGSLGTFVSQTLPSGWPSNSNQVDELIPYNGYMNILTNGTQDYYSRILSNGTLGATSLSTYSSFYGYNSPPAVYNGYLYGISFAYDRITYQQLNSSGGLGQVQYASNADIFSEQLSYYSITAYDGYLYVMGGTAVSGNQNDCNTTTTTSTACNLVWAAPISKNGNVGKFNIVGTLGAVDSSGQASIYNGYLYYASGSSGGSYDGNIYSAPINVVPHVARYSYLANFNANSNNTINNSNLVPSEIKILGNAGYNYGIGADSQTGGQSLYYSFADASNTGGCTTTAFGTQYLANYNSYASNLLNIVNPTTISKDACNQPLIGEQFTDVLINIDDSYSFTFPDDSSSDGSHSTISTISINSHPLPQNRLRLGKSFINNGLSPLDAQP